MQLTFDYILDEATSGAIIDPTERYRYSLWRCWHSGGPRVTFIMLNPSTADEQKNDPTITRCINFAKQWGFGSLEVVNLFAYRATNPEELLSVEDPIGAYNDTYIIDALRRSQVAVLAWGTKGTLLNRNRQVLNLVASFDLYALELSKDGHPKHPLYIRADTKPFPYLHI